MSDFLAGLNGPAPEPKPEFDEGILFQTTDFLNFDFESSNTFESQGDNVSPTSNFTSWNGLPNNDFIPSGE